MAITFCKNLYLNVNSTASKERDAANVRGGSTRRNRDEVEARRNRPRIGHEGIARCGFKPETTIAFSGGGERLTMEGHTDFMSTS
jgi:hypothetical protein